MFIFGFFDHALLRRLALLLFIWLQENSKSLLQSTVRIQKSSVCWLIWQDINAEHLWLRSLLKAWHDRRGKIHKSVISKILAALCANESRRRGGVFFALKIYSVKWTRSSRPTGSFPCIFPISFTIGRKSCLKLLPFEKLLCFFKDDDFTKLSLILIPNSSLFLIVVPNEKTSRSFGRMLAKEFIANAKFPFEW